MDIIKDNFVYIISSDGIRNIIASIVSAILTYIILAIFRIRIPNLSNILFWKSFSKKLIIVISEVPIEFEPLTRVGAQPQLTPICDAMALADFLNFFRSECKANPQIVSVNSKSDFDLIKDNNLLIIGGPKYNIAALEFLKEIDSELIYQFKRIRQQYQFKANDPDLKFFVSNAPQYSNLQCKSDDEIDYGTIVIYNSPYVSAKKIVLIAGLSTLSSLAGANWIRTRPFHFWLRLNRQQKGAQIIIKCRSIDRVKVSNIEEVFNHAII
jgi:hypothetical protein